LWRVEKSIQYGPTEGFHAGRRSGDRYAALLWLLRGADCERRRVTTLEFAWRWLSDNSDTLGVVVALVASLLAFAGLWLGARALRRQARAQDIATYLDIRHRLVEAVRAMRQAGPANVELGDLLDLLETICGLHKSRHLDRATHNALQGDLVGAFHAIEVTASAKDGMTKALSPTSPFVALKWFHRKHQAEIARRAVAP
jgi:hypothetical protein